MILISGALNYVSCLGSYILCNNYNFRGSRRLTPPRVPLQLIKLAFDEEVTVETIERLKKLIQRLRAPPTVAELFAFRGQHFVTASVGSKDKQKNATLR